MSKKAKILIILFSFSFLIIIYLILTAEKIPLNEKGQPLNLKTSNGLKLEEEYKARVKPILDQYLTLTKATNGITINQIAEIKNQLLAIKNIPAEYKDLHVNLVIAMDKMDSYLKDGKEEEKLLSQRIIDQARVDYDWLNK